MSHAFQGLPYSEVKEALQREIAKEVDRTLRDHSSAIARIIKGQVPVPGSTTVTFGVTSHHLLTDLATFDDHPQYLYLPGRASGQILNALSTSSALRIDIGALASGQALKLVATNATAWPLRIISSGNISQESILLRDSADTNTLFIVKGDGSVFSVPGYGSAAGDTSMTLAPTSLAFIDSFSAPYQYILTSRSFNIEVGGNSLASTKHAIQVGANADVIINPDGDGTTGSVRLTTKGSSGQTADLQSWQNSGATITAKVDKDCRATFPVLSITDPNFSSIIAILSSGGVYSAGGPEFDDGFGFRMVIVGPPSGFTANRYLELPDGGGQVVLAVATQIISLKTLAVTCVLNSISASSGVAFQDQTTTTKKLRAVLSGAVGNNSLTVANTAARDYKLEDVPGTLVAVGNGADPPAAGAVGKVNRTAQAAAIGATKLTDTTPAGYYVVHYTLEDTTGDVTAGTIQFQISYTDDIGATTQVGAALVLTGTGRDRGTWEVYLASGNITYQTNLVGAVNNARYALRVRCEFLGS